MALQSVRNIGNSVQVNKTNNNKKTLILKLTLKNKTKQNKIYSKKAILNFVSNLNYK
jgi:hypothetical protein